MKHLAMDYHFVWDLVAKKELQVSHVLSSHQLVDLPTKPLGLDMNFLLPRLVSLRSPQSCGGVKEQYLSQHWSQILWISHTIIIINQ
jgi:hypothetical protein